MDERALVVTRRALHGVAELLIAGPQHRASGTIRLRVLPGGFGGVSLPVRVRGARLEWDGGSAPLAGTFRELASAAGIDPGAPSGIYRDGSGLSPDDPVEIDGAAEELLLEWFAVGDAALRGFAPGTDPVLWPEHFDVAITANEVNYGVSPGDAAHPRPYAYVGPWSFPDAARPSAFWNAPFGALRWREDLADVGALVEWFTAGARQWADAPGRSGGPMP
jgi:hypothetical protein